MKNFLKIGDENSGESVVRTIVSIFFVVLGFYIYFIFAFGKYINGDDSLSKILEILATFSTPIAAALAVSYFYAYKYLDEIPYFYIAVGWLVNTLYLPLDVLIKDPCKEAEKLDCYNYRLSVYVFSLISSVIFFYAALRKEEENENRIKNYFNAFSKSNKVLYFALIPLFIINIVLIYYSWQIAEWFNTGGGPHHALRFTVSAFLGQLFSMYALIYLGYTFKSSLLFKNRNKKKGFVKYLPYTFYFYGIIQIFYPFHIYLSQNYPVLDFSMFFFAMTFKLVNLGCLFVLLRIKLIEADEASQQKIEKEIALLGEIAEKEKSERTLLSEKSKLEVAVAKQEVNKAKLEAANATIKQKEIEEKLREAQAARTKALLEKKIEEEKRIKAELEKENTELQKELEKTTQLASLGAVVASIEHDIRIPSTNLEGKLKELTNKLKEYGVYEKVSSILKRIKANKNRISATAEIIRFVRAEESFYKKLMSKLSVQKVLNDAISEVKSALRLDPKKYFFRHNLINKDFAIFGYEEMIFRVLVNLFTNSYEALDEKKEKKGTITIDVNQIKQLPEEMNEYLDSKYPRQLHFERWVRIDVSDEGCGIPEEIIDEITKVFTTKEKANGGIGLFITKKVLDIHHSIIYFRSEVGMGTTVSLFFPEFNVYKEFLEKEFGKRDEGFENNQSSEN